jgi:hypothetical protein
MRKFFPLMLFSILILSLFTALFSSVSASELVENSWNTKTSMTQERFSLGVAAVEGKIYAIGGFTRSGYLGLNEQYDPETDTWITLTSMPTSRNAFAIVACQGKIYCIGGIASNGNGWFWCGVNEVYDVASDSWSIKASLPVNGTSLQAHAMDGKVFVIIEKRDLYMYDPNSDSWTKKSQIPYIDSRNSIVSVTVDDKILVFYVIKSDYSGGDQNNVAVRVYDVKMDKWSEGKTQEVDMGDGMVAVATSGVYAPKRVYFLGAGADNTVVYNPATEAWSTTEAMCTPRFSFGAAIAEDILYVIGGNKPYTVMEFLATNEQYVPIGYHTDPSPVTSEPSEPFNHSLSYDAAMVLVVLTIGIVTAGLLFYFKKRKPINVAV